MQTDWLTDTVQVIGEKNSKNVFAIFFPVGDSRYFWNDNFHVTQNVDWEKWKSKWDENQNLWLLRNICFSLFFLVER